MPDRSRRSHTKSRNGCRQCKCRKVKCSEQAPRCANCRKWQVRCDFESPDRASTAQGANKVTQRQVIIRPRQKLTTASLDINLAHLELMHHYLTVTSSTLAQPGPATERLEAAIQTEALRCDFVMHAVLGISALHLAHLRGPSLSRDEVLVRARVHQHEALTRFRSATPYITPENCTAAFLFSNLLLTFSSAICQVAVSSNEDDIDGIVNIIKMFRSHWKLFVASQKWIEAGPMGKLAPPGDKEKNLKASRSEDTFATLALQNLHDFNTKSPSNSGKEEIYCDTILQMCQSLQSRSYPPGLLWPIFVSDAFVDLMSRKHPMALILLAHGCALANQGLDLWFTQGWRARVVQAILGVLDATWWERMSWPIQEFGLHNINE